MLNSISFSAKASGPILTGCKMLIWSAEEIQLQKKVKRWRNISQSPRP